MDTLDRIGRRPRRTQSADRPEDGSGAGGGGVTISEEQLQTMIDAMEKAQAALKFVRASQLERMAQLADRRRWEIHGCEYLPFDNVKAWAKRKTDRLSRFASACRVEIARLKGEG